MPRWVAAINFTRGTHLAPITQAQLDQVSSRLNQGPRKTLGFQIGYLDQALTWTHEGIALFGYQASLVKEHNYRTSMQQQTPEA